MCQQLLACGDEGIGKEGCMDNPESSPSTNSAVLAATTVLLRALGYGGWRVYW